MKYPYPLVFLFIIVTVSSEAVHACICEPPKRPYKISKAVFFGSVVEIVDGKDRCSQVVKFKVERYWKGIESEYVSLQTPKQVMGCCGYHFQVSHRYLIYSGIENGQLETGPCRILAEDTAAKSLKKLGKGRVPTERTVSLIVTPNKAGAPKTQEASKRFKLKSEPQLGMKLPFKRSSTDLRMTSSGSLAPAYEVEHEGLEFTICAYKDKLVHYVDTDDPNFRTPEGITAGESLKNVLEISKGELIREQGWAFYVRLKSGWNAAFLQGDATEGELSPDAKVRFLFKR